MKDTHNLSATEMAQQIRTEKGEVYAASLGRLLIKKIQYFVKVRGKKKHKTTAHIWDGEDTICGIYSRGGLDPDNYQITDSPRGKRICIYCEKAE